MLIRLRETILKQQLECLISKQFKYVDNNVNLSMRKSMSDLYDRLVAL